MDDRVVGIDASRMNIRRRTGTENYSNQIIQGLAKQEVPWRWRLYFNAPTVDPSLLLPPGVEVRSLPARRLWTHNRLSREMLINRPDILFVPAHVIPLVHPRTIVTVHDLGYLHQPDAHPAGQRRMLDLTTRWSAKTAHHIIAPSTRTQRDLIEHYNVPESRISVVHHGVDPRFRTIDRSKESDLRNRYGLNRPFVLAVGTIQPRKNLSILARAMADANVDHDLVIAGKRGWLADQVLAELKSAGLGGRLRLLDYVPDADLPNLYAAADIFVQPSRFEGFGMPVLEAMAAGTPVLCAAGSSLTEIAGNAAVLFEPDDIQTLTKYLETIPGDRSCHEQLRQKGLAWSSRFTWERAARETRSIVEKALT